MTSNKGNMDNVILFLDESRGVYIPKKFAQIIDTDCIIDYPRFKDYFEVLKEVEPYGEDSTEYWDCWQSILDNMQIKDNDKVYSLYQDGDLFLVDYENMTEEESKEFFGEY